MLWDRRDDVVSFFSKEGVGADAHLDARKGGGIARKGGVLETKGGVLETIGGVLETKGGGTNRCCGTEAVLLSPVVSCLLVSPLRHVTVGDPGF